MEFKIVEDVQTEHKTQKANLPPGFGLIVEDPTKLKEAMPEYDFDSEPYEARNLLAQIMHEACRIFNGAGLSANQMSMKVRMFVMRIPRDFGGPNEQPVQEFEKFTCYNPKVLSVGEDVAMREGCLSFPGLSLQVKRPAWVEAEYQNERGEVVRNKLHGLAARCYLHELDHMNGVVFISKVTSGILGLERQKQQKLLKKVQKRAKQNGSRA